MSEKYSGLVIGGPKAGQYIENKSPWLLAPICNDDFDVISVYPRGTEGPLAFETYRYKHIRGFCDENPMNFWIEDKRENSLSTCFYELLKFYRNNT